MVNQTDETWLAGISPTDKGAGLYVIGMNGKVDRHWDYGDMVFPGGRGYMFKVIQDNLTYWECIDLAENEKEMIAFKWIPATIASLNTIKDSLYDCKPETPCVSRCASYGCICIRGKCL